MWMLSMIAGTNWVPVNYTDAHGHQHFFHQEVTEVWKLGAGEGSLFQKLKNRIGAPAEVDYIEIDRPEDGLTITATIGSHIHNLPHHTQQETRDIIVEFFLDPDFLGFHPEIGEFPAVERNEDIYPFIQAIHWRIHQAHHDQE